MISSSTCGNVRKNTPMGLETKRKLKKNDRTDSKKHSTIDAKEVLVVLVTSLSINY